MNKERVEINAKEVTSAVLLSADNEGKIDLNDVSQIMGTKSDDDKSAVESVANTMNCYDGQQIIYIDEPDKLSEQCEECPLVNDCLVGDVLRGDIEF